MRDISTNVKITIGCGNFCHINWERLNNYQTAILLSGNYFHFNHYMLDIHNFMSTYPVLYSLVVALIWVYTIVLVTLTLTDFI